MIHTVSFKRADMAMENDCILLPQVVDIVYVNDLNTAELFLDKLARAIARVEWYVEQGCDDLDQC